jgi:DNA modification methylase
MNNLYEQDNLKIFNADCMEVMKNYPDKYFDLCVVDPPYGIGAIRLTTPIKVKRI